jgi:hypothetical protein
MLAALNKFFRAVSYDEYMDKWDLPTTKNAVAIAGFSKEVETWIWEPEAFTLF